MAELRFQNTHIQKLDTNIQRVMKKSLQFSLHIHKFNLDTVS